MEVPDVDYSKRDAMMQRVKQAEERLKKTEYELRSKTEEYERLLREYNSMVVPKRVTYEIHNEGEHVDKPMFVPSPVKRSKAQTTADKGMF
jgi:hypothetical protein